VSQLFYKWRMLITYLKYIDIRISGTVLGIKAQLKNIYFCLLFCFVFQTFPVNHLKVIR